MNSLAVVAVAGVALCVIAVLIVAVLAIVLWRPKQRHPASPLASAAAPVESAAAPGTPLDILNRRLASGEITVDQYREIKQIIAPEAPATYLPDEPIP